MISELRFKRLLTRAALLPLLLLAALSGLLIWQVNHLLGVFQWVGHTNIVIAQANAAQKLTLDMETGKRGYLLSGDRAFLQPYQAADTQVGPALDRLAGLVADNGVQKQRVTALRLMLKKWQLDAHTRIAQRGLTPNTPVLIRDIRGKGQMDAMREQFQSFILDEETLRDARARTARHTAQEVVATSLLAALLGGIFLGLSSRRQLQELAREYAQATETMRRQADELHQRELRLSTLLRSLGEGVLATDALGHLTLLNPEAEALTGWSHGDAVGQQVSDVFRLRGYENGEPILRVLTGKQPFDDHAQTEELVLVSRDGREIPVDVSASPISGGDIGETQLGVVTAFRDVTDRRLAEVEQAKLSRSNQLLLDSAEDGIYGVDNNGLCMFINKAGARLIGTSPEEALGRNMHALTHHTKADGTIYPLSECPIYQVLQTRESCRVEEEVFWKFDGTSFPVAYTASPIVENGRVQGTVVSVCGYHSAQAGRR